MVLKLDKEKAERIERCKLVAEFSRNLDLCFDIIKKKQDKTLKNVIGVSEFNRIFQELPIVVKHKSSKSYRRESDSGELVRIVFNYLRDTMGCDLINFTTAMKSL